MTQADHLFLGMRVYELLTLLAIVVGPLIAVGITVKTESRRRRREQQTQTMRMLVSTRHFPGDANYTTAINMIPIDFNKNRRIMAAWSSYIEVIQYRPAPENAEAHDKKIVAKQTNLIFEIMQLLGYNLSETEIQATPYAAGGFVERDNMMINAWRSWPRIAAALEGNATAAVALQQPALTLPKQD